MTDTPTPADRPVAPARWADPVVEFVRTHRAAVGGVLVGVGVLFVVLAGVLAYRGGLFGGGPAPDPAAADSPFDAVKPTRLDAGDFVWGVAWAVVATFPPLMVGIWLLAGTPLPDPAAERTRTRVALLAAVGGLGLDLMLAGLLFFVRWSDRLLKWLDGTGGVNALQWPVFALLFLVVGAGLVVLAVQPARAEERNNPTLRRLVYGSNLLLTALLLIAVLLAGNLVASQRVTNRLDVTTDQFYTISPQTEAVLAQLDRPVTAYGILPEGAGEREADDTRRLLLKCQELAAGKFTARFISSIGSEYNRLKAKYPEIDLYQAGVLVTAGEDGSKHGFIRYDELTSREGGRGAESRRTFVGEARLLRELKFVSEGGGKPVVYFTQSAGELAIADPPPGDAPPSARRTCKQLKEYLEKNNFEVRPLQFAPGDAAPKVPDDAAVVVVADPTAPFAAPAVEAVRRFTADARPDGKKGKLLVLAGAHAGVDRKAIKLGLEDVLKGFNVGLPDVFVLGVPSQNVRPTDTIVEPYTGGAPNPVAASVKASMFVMPDCRLVQPLKDNPAIQAVPVLTTIAGRQTWIEPDLPADPYKALDELDGNAALQRAKGLTAGRRVVAVTASEGTTARVAVIGNGAFVSDEVNRGGRGSDLFDLIGSSLDWLRDRPAVSGVASKAYTTYTLPPDVDWTRLLWLPVGLMLLAVVGVGTGVWVVRRS